jgi:hypothetical protein
VGRSMHLTHAVDTPEDLIQLRILMEAGDLQ